MAVVEATLSPPAVNQDVACGQVPAHETVELGDAALIISPGGIHSKVTVSREPLAAVETSVEEAGEGADRPEPILRVTLTDL